MTEEKLAIEYPLSQLADKELAGLFAATTLWNQHCPALAVVMGKATQQEAFRRASNRDGSSTHLEPGYIGVDFGDWSDKDIGQALIMAQAFTTHQTLDPKFGELWDAIWKAIHLVAAARLINSADPRNAA